MESMSLRTFFLTSLMLGLGLRLYPTVIASALISQRPLNQQNGNCMNGGGSEYQRKFGYAFVTCAFGKSSDEILSELKVRYTNMPLVELDVACREEMKWIELHLTNHYVDFYFDSDSTQEAEEKYEDISDGVEAVMLNSVEVNSLGTDHATEFDTNNDPPENVRGVDENQSKAEEHVRPERGFDLIKEPW
ncbi:hypothetical protein PIB30_071295 [Stylosanthes scabra]|uniref:2-oxo-4-hydroxy-4-carboxy-5-ureidoimidazoline decarboxylase n=1 Tax=Stylosanthes scabra TaxID=79078 RepID=A0ABU6QNB3_9FABA|nr:hypothetical protein [Stylosanthes scabra]